MLKKLAILLTLFILALTACSAANSGQAGQPGAPGNGKLNDMSELIIGTLKLDGTANAVTKEQAGQLIPLWEVYKQLLSSDTAAQAEIDGLTKQIKGSMTSEQLKAISSMGLTGSDMMSYVQQAAPAASGAPQSSTSRSNSGGMQGGPGGGMPGGMPPAGGMPGGDFAGPPPSGTQTANSTMRAPATMNRVPTVLIDTLLQYLKKLSAS